MARKRHRNRRTDQPVNKSRSEYPRRQRMSTIGEILAAKGGVGDPDVIWYRLEQIRRGRMESSLA